MALNFYNYKTECPLETLPMISKIFLAAVHWSVDNFYTLVVNNGYMAAIFDNLGIFKITYA